MCLFKKNWLEYIEKISKLFLELSITEFEINYRFSCLRFGIKRLKITKAITDKAINKTINIFATREGLFIPFDFEHLETYEAGHTLGVIQYDLLLSSEEHFEYLHLPCRCIVTKINQRGVVVEGQGVAIIKPV